MKDAARREKDIPAVVRTKYMETTDVSESDCKRLTVAQMCEKIKNLQEDGKRDTNILLQSFVAFCVENGFNNPMVRTGNEVVLDCALPFFKK